MLASVAVIEKQGFALTKSSHNNRLQHASLTSLAAPDPPALLNFGSLRYSTQNCSTRSGR